MNSCGLRHILAGTLLAAMAGPITSVAAANPQPEPHANAAAAEPKPVEPPKEANTPKVAVEKSTEAPGPSFRAAVRAMVEQEVRKTGLPADIADAVVKVESNYDPSVIGGVGEIGLMQIRPGTAAMLGFRGSTEELAKPEINIRYGVAYLSKAWRLANGDLCRTLMKYRAGHGQEVMTPRSVNYCNRARNHLAALGAPLTTGGRHAACYHPGFGACEQPAEVAADFTEGCLRAISAGDARGEPGLLDSSRSPYPRHQGADQIQMAPTGVTLRVNGADI